MALTKEKILQQVAEVRAGANIFLTDTALHHKRIGDTVVAGTVVTQFEDPVEIACRLIIRSGSVSDNIAAQPRLVEQQKFTGLFRMQVPYDLDIRIGDQITYTDQMSGQERLLDVVFTPAHNDYTGAVVITLQEVS